MDIQAIEEHMFDYDNLRDVNLSPSLAAKWGLNPVNGQGLCTMRLDDLIKALSVYLFEHPFNRGMGGVYNPRTTTSVKMGFNKFAFGLVTAAIISNVNEDPDYPPVFLMLADAHNRCLGLLRAYEDGALSPSDLDHPVAVQIIPASQFIEVYGLLNTCRSQTGAEKYTHPVLRYGHMIFKLAQRARLSKVGKSFSCQLAYLLEYYESNSIGKDTLYAGLFEARVQAKRKALHRASEDPILLSPGKEDRLVRALEWLSAVRANVDRNLGGKILENSPFEGMLLVWHLRGESKIGKTAKGFAKKLDKKAFDLKPLMSCITHSGDTSITATEYEILKHL